MSRFSSDSPKRPLWQLLLAPMLFLSLGLHALLLFTPLAASDDEAVPPPDPEEDSIAITRIPPSEAGPAPEATDVTVPAEAVQSPAPKTANPAATSNPSANQPPASGNVRNRNVPRLNSNNGNNRSNRSSDPSASVSDPNPDPPNPSSRLNPEPPSMVIDPLPQDKAAEFLASLQLSNRVAGFIPGLRASLRERYAYSPENTTRSAYDQNETEWIAEVRQETGNSNLEVETYFPPLDVTHKQRVCLTPEPMGRTFIGFVLAPDGRLKSEPVLLRSSGYQFLDEKVMAAFSAADLEAPEVTTAYTIKVEVEVDYGSFRGEDYDCLQVQSPESDPS